MASDNEIIAGEYVGVHVPSPHDDGNGEMFGYGYVKKELLHLAEIDFWGTVEIIHLPGYDSLALPVRYAIPIDKEWLKPLEGQELIDAMSDHQHIISWGFDETHVRSHTRIDV